MINNIKKYLFEIIILLIVFIINIVLQFLPLTNVIGYEFSTINGILLFLTGGFSVLYFGRKTKNYHSLKIFKQNIFFFLLLAFLPLIISVFNTLFLSICPFSNGVEFYFIDSLTSLFLAILLAGISLRISLKWSQLIFSLIFLGFVFTPIFELYFFHQMYFYSPLIGFFPGTIYDELIKMNSKHFLYQLFSLKLTFLAYIFIVKKEKLYKYSLPIFVTYFLFASFLKPYLGFATNLNKIEKILPKKIESENFLIIYPGDISSKEIEIIKSEHEFYYHHIKKLLGYSPEGKITSILFENREQKGEVFGAQNADVAKLWMNTIYLQKNDYSNTLEHELVHVFSKEIGTTPFKVAAGFNFSLIEGYAMAIENDYAGKEVHHFAALAFSNGYQVLPSDLFSGLNFFSNVSSLSYVISGSFIKYLADTYSYEQVNNLYQDGDFEKHFGKSLDDLSKEYEAFIKNYHIEVNEHTSNLYFGRKPLVKRFCPRYIARIKDKADKYFERKMFTEAKNTYSEMFELTNQYSALSGIVKCYQNENKFDSAKELMLNHINDYLNTSYHYSYNLSLADLYMYTADYKMADSIYTIIESNRPNNSYTGFAKLRRAILMEDPETINSYVTSGNYDRYEIIKNVYEKTKAPYLINSMINLSEIFGENPNVFFNIISKNLKNSPEETSFAAYQLSEYAKKKANLETAIYYAKIALETCNDNSRIPILKENLNKLDWMKKYCD